MANHASSLKRARQDAKIRLRNRARKAEMRTAVKKVRTAIQSGDQAAANEALREAASLIDRAGRKGVIHRSQASRRVSRLNAAVKALIA